MTGVCQSFCPMGEGGGVTPNASWDRSHGHTVEGQVVVVVRGQPAPLDRTHHPPGQDHQTPWTGPTPTSKGPTLQTGPPAPTPGQDLPSTPPPPPPAYIQEPRSMGRRYPSLLECILYNLFLQGRREGHGPLAPTGCAIELDRLYLQLFVLLRFEITPSGSENFL